MKSKTLTVAIGVIGAAAVLVRAQAPAPAPELRTGPGVQAANDAKEPEVLATCKVPLRHEAAVEVARAGGAPLPRGVPKTTPSRKFPGLSPPDRNGRRSLKFPATMPMASSPRRTAVFSWRRT